MGEVCLCSLSLSMSHCLFFVFVGFSQWARSKQQTKNTNTARVQANKEGCIIQAGYLVLTSVANLTPGHMGGESSTEEGGRSY